MRRKLGLGAYGVLCYAGSLASFFFVFAWLGGPAGIPFPWRLNQAQASPSALAFAGNVALFIAFGLYHSLLARSSVKRNIRRFLPRTLERATYCLTSAVLTVVLCLLWQPFGPVLWEMPSAAGAQAMQLLHVLLWVVHLTAIVLMNHNEFFGLRQIGQAMRGSEYRPPPPVSEFYYLWTRLMLVISLALIPWATSVITASRLEFCLFATTYVALGAWLSNRDRGDFETVAGTASQGTAAAA
jgi:protein-S-isoprenylcysteine O-methyltransferase Ste14